VRERTEQSDAKANNLIFSPANNFSSFIDWRVPASGYAHFRGLFFVTDTRSHGLFLLTCANAQRILGARAIIDVTINGLQRWQICAVERYLIEVGFNAQNIDYGVCRVYRTSRLGNSGGCRAAFCDGHGHCDTGR
jgi:hypothetical protein